MTTAPEDNIRQVTATTKRPETTTPPFTSSVPTMPPAMGGQTPWVKAGTVQTVNGPVDVDANGKAVDGSTPIAVSEEFVAEQIVQPKLQSTYTDPETGDIVDVYDDGTEKVRKKGTVKMDAATAAAATAAERLTDRVSAYDLLYSQFKDLGLESLVEDIKDSIINSQSQSERIIALRGSKAYQKRFAANAQRIAKGLRPLDEADYLAKEDAYQNLMRNYGLPETYWKKDTMGTQAGFEQLIANDVSSVELEDRLMTAQNRVLNSNPEVLKALKDFYPDINNGDILAYTLDPKNAIENIKRKVTAAEIGGAAMQANLSTNLSRAEELQRYGVDKAAATEGYSVIGSGLQRGSELASIYGQSPYTQATAEAEVFKLPAAEEARKQRQKITGLEKATFGGQTGLTSGALARDRAGGI